jgi:hypothetical protein
MRDSSVKELHSAVLLYACVIMQQKVPLIVNWQLKLYSTTQCIQSPSSCNDQAATVPSNTHIDALFKVQRNGAQCNSVLHSVRAAVRLVALVVHAVQWLSSARVSSTDTISISNLAC